MDRTKGVAGLPIIRNEAMKIVNRLPHTSQCLLHCRLAILGAFSWIRASIYVPLSHRRVVHRALNLLVLGCLCLSSTGCSPRHSHLPLAPLLSARERADLIRALQNAEEMDESQVLDPNVSMVIAEDSAVQANTANKAIQKLRRGLDVSNGELSAGLEVPPPHLSPEARANLIQQLEDAKALDDQREQELLSDYFSDRPVYTENYDVQKQLVNEVVKDLEMGQDVHLSVIHEALRVPRSH